MSRVDQQGSGGPDRWQVGGIETVNSDGRIKIPARIREVLGVAPKDELHIGYDFGTRRRVLAGSEIVDPGVKDLDANTLYGASNRFRYTIPSQQRAEKPGLDHMVQSWQAVPDDARLACGQTFVFVYPVTPADPQLGAEPNCCYLVPWSAFNQWLSDPADSQASISVDTTPLPRAARSHSADGEARWRVVGRDSLSMQRIPLSDRLLTELGLQSGDPIYWGVETDTMRVVVGIGPVGGDTTSAGDSTLGTPGDGHRITLPAQLFAPEPEGDIVRRQWQTIPDDAKFEAGADLVFVYRDDGETEWCYVLTERAFSEWVSPPGEPVEKITTAADTAFDHSAAFGSFPEESGGDASSADDEST